MTDLIIKTAAAAAFAAMALNATAQSQEITGDNHAIDVAKQLDMLSAQTSSTIAVLAEAHADEISAEAALFTERRNFFQFAHVQFAPTDSQINVAYTGLPVYEFTPIAD